MCGECEVGLFDCCWELLNSCIGDFGEFGGVSGKIGLGILLIFL